MEKFQHHGEAKNQNRCTEEGKKNSFTLFTSPFPQCGTAQCQERPPWPSIFPSRESKGKMSAQFPQPVALGRGGPLFLFPPRTLRAISTSEASGGSQEQEKVRAVSSQCRELNNRHILLASSWTPPGAPPASPMGCVTCRTPH